MGTATLSEMRSRVQFVLEQRTDVDPGTAAGVAKLNTWINRAYRHVTLPTVFEHDELRVSDTITLVDGTTEYALPTNLYAIEFVINETISDRYEPEEARELLDSTSGRERSYARRGSSIFIRANAATDAHTVRIYYWKRPALLSADSDVTVIQEYWDDVIEDGAAGHGCAAVGELQRADYFDERVARFINEHRKSKVFEARDAGWRNDPLVARMGGYQRVR